MATTLQAHCLPGAPRSFVAQVETLYWVGGAGNWSDSANWANTSGGSGGYGTPDADTNVIFDDNSDSGSAYDVTIDVATGSCRALVVEASLTNPPTFLLNGNTLHCNGQGLFQSGGITHGSSSVLRIDGNRQTNVLTPVGGGSAGTFRFRSSGWWKYDLATTNPDVYDLDIADDGQTVTLMPVGNAPFGTDINIRHQLITGDETATINCDRSLATGDQWICLEIKAGGIAEGTGSAVIDGLSGFEREATGMILNPNWTFQNWHFGGSGNFGRYDLTGGGASNWTYTLPGNLDMGGAQLILDKQVTIDVGGFAITNCLRVRAGDGSGGIAVIDLDGGSLAVSDYLELRGNASSIDLGTGGTITAAYLKSNSSAANCPITGGEGSQLTLTTANPLAGTARYFANAGDNGNTGDTTGNPKETFAHALTIIDTPYDCLFNRGEQHVVNDTEVVNQTDGTIGAYGTGDRPLMVLGAGETFYVANTGVEHYDVTYYFGTPPSSGTAPRSRGLTGGMAQLTGGMRN